MSLKPDMKRKNVAASAVASALSAPPALVSAPLAPGKKLQVLHGLLDEVSQLHNSLLDLTTRLHADDHAGASAARRSLLRMLVDQGAQTVPDLARKRDVSRQFIQVEVNALLAEGLVEYLDNPRHRRSKLVRITPRGFALYKTLRLREEPISHWLVEGFSKSELRQTLDLITRIRQLVDDYAPATEPETK